MTDPVLAPLELRTRLEQLIAKWRDDAARHEKHGDCYRKGQGWGLNDCADELKALLASLVVERRPEEEEKKDDTREDDSQYAERSGTAASNEARPTKKRRRYRDSRGMVIERNG